MSVKAQSLVWDLKCPQKYGAIDFRPSHKFVLVAYADHADHNGNNIFPAIMTIVRKTGLDERTVQRLTRDLENIGLLIEDGQGPRGTNRWSLPYSVGGDTLTPVMLSPVEGGDKNENSLGDIPSGDIPSGDTMSPEFKEQNQEILINLIDNFSTIWEETKEQVKNSGEIKKAQFITWVEPTYAFRFENGKLSVIASNSLACEWLNNNFKSVAQNKLGVYVDFVIGAE